MFLWKKLESIAYEDDITDIILKAHQRSFQRVFETAVRTETALIFNRNGKIVEIKPPYRYVLVPIQPKKKKKTVQTPKKR